MFQLFGVLFAVRLSVPEPPLILSVTEPPLSVKSSFAVPPTRLLKSVKVTPATEPSFYEVSTQVLSIFSAVSVLFAPAPISFSIFTTSVLSVTLIMPDLPE